MLRRLLENAAGVPMRGRRTEAMPKGVEAAETRLLLSAVPPASPDQYFISEGETLAGGTRHLEISFTAEDGTNVFRRGDSASSSFADGVLTIIADGTAGGRASRAVIRLSDPAGTGRLFRPRSEVLAGHSTVDTVGGASTQLAVSLRDSGRNPVAWDLSDATLTVTRAVRNGDGGASQYRMTVESAGGTFTLDYVDSILGNDPGSGIQAVLKSQPASGTLTFGADGRFDYTPDAGFVGRDSFTYQTRFPNGAVSDVATVTIDVEPDVAVQASGSVLQVVEDIPRRFASSALPTDVPMSRSYRRVVTEPEHGRVVFHHNGAVTYIPEADYFGEDSFEYVVGDGVNESDPARVDVSVTPRRDDAKIYAEVGGEVHEVTGGMLPELPFDERSPAGTLVARVWAESVDPQPLDLRLASTRDSQLFDFNAETGELRLSREAPAYAARTADRTFDLPFRLFQAGHPVVQKFAKARTQNVYDLPTAEDAAIRMPEDTVRVFGGNLFDTSTETGRSRVRVVRQPANAKVQATADGGFKVTPNADFFGTDSFEYVVNDGQNESVPATVTLTILPRHDEPKLFFERNGEVTDITTGDVPAVTMWEWTPPGTVIGRVWAESVDPQKLDLRLVATSGSRSLALNSETGELTVVGEVSLSEIGIPYENYPLTFRLFQRGHSTLTRSTTLQVHDTDDPPVLMPVRPVTLSQGETIEVPFRAVSPEGLPVYWSIDQNSVGITVYRTGEAIGLSAESAATPGTHEITITFHAGTGTSQLTLPVTVVETDFSVEAEVERQQYGLLQPRADGTPVLGLALTYRELDGQNVSVRLEDGSPFAAVVSNRDEAADANGGVTSGRVTFEVTDADTAASLPPVSELTVHFSDGTSEETVVTVPILSSLGGQEVLPDRTASVGTRTPVGFGISAPIIGDDDFANWEIISGPAAGYFEYDAEFRTLRVATTLPEVVPAPGQSGTSSTLFLKATRLRDGRDVVLPLLIQLRPHTAVDPQVPHGVVLTTTPDTPLSFTADDIGAVFPDGDGELFLSLDDDQHGHLTRNTDDSFTFTPPPGESGQSLIIGAHSGGSVIVRFE